MKSEKINLAPAEALLQKHKQHDGPYLTEFKGKSFVIYPDVFNPSYTKVSGFLADEMEIGNGTRVLDMFSGSGAMGLLAASYASYVVGVDVSESAVTCARENASRLNLSDKTEFRHGRLWEVVDDNEKFDIMVANPPLLPVLPESVLEMAIADSPEMKLSVGFLAGCRKHLEPSGVVFMTFSNACKAYVGDPLSFIGHVAKDSGLEMEVKAEKDVGYEVYRILRFKSC